MVNFNARIMKKIIVISCFISGMAGLVLPFQSHAQQQFIVEGKIEYERKTNQHALMDDNNVWDEMAKKNLPKFVTYYQDLYFKNNRTLFKAGRETDQIQRKSWSVLDADDIIASNLDSSFAISQKNFFGEYYLISDSIRNIQWKISPEIRKIAGFDCRKATGRVLDSIVVIAFYTDEILTQGGPESFAGLPGMILGVAIPRMHTTWYATKLELIPVKETDLLAPKKGKKYKGPEFRKDLRNLMKNWDENSQKLEWQLVL